ncbi:MAG: winged helix DNA-binding domain-containing protein [Nitrospirae bacterium]|nr:winged helix DNA-binding domain-containing protein [Nitrospirota bacterium]MDA8340436.1 winged helix DNA-binding domain-containing protein [Nitrospiraceae bacterium]
MKPFNLRRIKKIGLERRVEEDALLIRKNISQVTLLLVKDKPIEAQSAPKFDMNQSSMTALDIAHYRLHESIDSKTYWMSPDVPELSLDEQAVYLLPGFDEYMLGYKDRSAALDPKYAQKICPGNNGMFSPTIVMDGEVVGTWKRMFKKDKIVITTDFFENRTKAGEAFYKAAERYGKFLGMSVTIA